MQRPFEGIKIVDMTHVLAGPFATGQLAMLGAEVIKVEPPEDPDMARSDGGDKGLADAFMGTRFLTTGANKRSLTVNIKTAEGRAIIEALVRDSDVFVENYRAGSFEALGLGYDDLKKINPRLIYCSLTAWGQDGPRRGQTGYDQVIQSYSGIMSITGTEATGPLRCGPQLVDIGAGIATAFAISSALFQRERTGRGQRIDACLNDVAFMMMGAQITDALRTGREMTYEKLEHGSPTYNQFQASDGKVMLAAANHRQYARLWQALGHPERANRSEAERLAGREEELALLNKIFLTKTAQEWEDFFQAHHVPAVRQRSVREALADPQVAHRRAFHRFEDGSPLVEGGYSVPLAPFTFAEGGPRIDSPPPPLGRDNQDILSALGYRAEEIETLRRKKVVG
ncbi:CaiB/BaiF CoA transferase family protein [Neotabrizicola sp. sgz301269]|uniref:CaiB/BaiF CoA transferase family protein n=1 Tax=Neotabrizicola sp. sgz301269 TaxID=3276282 RepID=UPI0037702AC3